jgi:MoaA/NifB/PqqE/SkfB family radical SAM enzyme
MQTTIQIPVKAASAQWYLQKAKEEIAIAESQQPGRIEKTAIWFLIKLKIFWLACIVLKSPKKIWNTFWSIIKLRNSLSGGDLKKMYKVDGKYYYNLYTPGWPSKSYDAFLKNELKRHADPLNIEEGLSFIFFAITRKCPMRCEHCFEWDNLNQKESFTKDDLFKVIDIYQSQGVLQFHFSGGEPMVRVKDLIELIRHTSKKSECWVVTSGFNFTKENAQLLKQAGCKGIVVSIDHYIPEHHNIFRGNKHAYEGAVNAVKEAKLAGMVTSLSVCATKNFIDGGHILPYMNFAKSLGVNFVQMLEPKNVGQYANKDVLLAPRHINELETIFKKVNHSPEYKTYPTMLYHGYHQRRIGCFSGSRSVYVDSAGDVHACPFCHTKSYNIIDVIRKGENKIPVKENSCPRYEKIA